MIEIIIDDPIIENHFQTKEDIVQFLRAAVLNQFEIPLLKQEVLSEDFIRATIQNYFLDKPVLKAYLFGSYSRKEATAKSDVDILVELDYSQSIGILFYRMSVELEELLNKKVDLLSSNAIISSLKESVEKEKVLIYERSFK